jgi:putative ATPase
MDLFDEQDRTRHAPLASRMRPASLADLVGQTHLLSEGASLRTAILEDRVPSLILYGPTGCGKSTLARVIAEQSQRRFIEFSATSSGVKAIREAADTARDERRLYSRGAIVFCDEIHRLNKAQQDSFLPHVEDGTFTLIGATTENPYFEVNAALLSRCLVLRLKPLEPEDLRPLVLRALADEQRGLGAMRAELEPGALEHLVHAANGDARRALNALEQAAFLADRDGAGVLRITEEAVREATQQRLVLYDREGQTHYDVISAYIKSIRGSDPDAAVFWLGYMLEAGEDPLFIARRMVIAASEDIGNAEPMGIVVAQAAAHAAEFVGMPEAQIPLAQATIFLACAPKSNRACEAVLAAREAVREAGQIAVPPHLMDIRHEAQRQDGLGVGYVYPHGEPGAFVDQRYLPERLAGLRLYHPSDRGREAKMHEFLRQRWPERFGPAE